MDIGIVGALFIITILGWIPVIIFFLVGTLILSKSTKLQSHSNIFLITAFFFGPAEFIFLRYFIYATDLVSPPIFIYALLMSAGIVFFLLISFFIDLHEKKILLI